MAFFFRILILAKVFIIYLCEQIWHGPDTVEAGHSLLCGEGQCKVHAVQLHGCPSAGGHPGRSLPDVQVSS